MTRVTIVDTELEFRNDLQERSATNYIVVHHVGDITRDVSAAEIHSWHLSNGWAGIGYHYVIRKDGTIERGRWRGYTGSHAYNSNWCSVGICVVGDSMQEDITPEQRASLVNLIAELCDIYELEKTRATIVGHRELNETSCPGDYIYNALESIVEDVRVA
jgi:N-acetyl-anhydromuramyl-L-alanine amidase AmpD